ncbi:MAG TPA: glycosyltransferase family 4 protein, partial [Chthoniobacterales bacterium]
NSQLVKREAVEYYGYPEARIDVVPNGVPLRDFRTDPETRRLRRKVLRLDEEEIAVLFVGSGWQRKGVRFAVRAVNSLGKNFRLLVAGRGRKRLARGRSIHRLGAVRDLPALYAAADIFLLPTLYDPFSNACLEAMASGLPVITTRDNGFSEIIENGVHGSILESASETAPIRDALLYWADPERRRTARSAILERAAHYDISINVGRTLAALHHAPSAESRSGKIRNT